MNDKTETELQTELASTRARREKLRADQEAATATADQERRALASGAGDADKAGAASTRAGVIGAAMAEVDQEIAALESALASTRAATKKEELRAALRTATEKGCEYSRDFFAALTLADRALSLSLARAVEAQKGLETAQAQRIEALANLAGVDPMTFTSSDRVEDVHRRNAVAIEARQIADSEPMDTAGGFMNSPERSGLTHAVALRDILQLEINKR